MPKWIFSDLKAKTTKLTTVLKLVGRALKFYYLEVVLLVVTIAAVIVGHFKYQINLVFFVFYVLVVVFLNKNFITSGVLKGLRDIRKQILKTYLLLIIVALMLIWGIGTELVIFWTIFLMFAFYSWDNRITAVGAIISLATCPILLIAKQDVAAERVAVYAFFFLTMTVTLQIVEYKRHPERFPDDEEDKKHE
jgi:hypothetical protein